MSESDSLELRRRSMDGCCCIRLGHGTGLSRSGTLYVSVDAERAVWSDDLHRTGRCSELDWESTGDRHRSGGRDSDMDGAGSQELARLRADICELRLFASKHGWTGTEVKRWDAAAAGLRRSVGWHHLTRNSGGFVSLAMKPQTRGVLQHLPTMAENTSVSLLFILMILVSSRCFSESSVKFDGGRKLCGRCRLQLNEWKL